MGGHCLVAHSLGGALVARFMIVIDEPARRDLATPSDFGCDRFCKARFAMPKGKPVMFLT